MKLIEAMKEVKRLEEKVNDLVNKIRIYCADMDFETPTYPDQRGKIKEWLQSSHDTIKEAQKLRIAIQKTNLNTIVAIELDGKKVEHSIAEWILRRRFYSGMEHELWRALTNKSLKDGQYKNSVGEVLQAKVRMYYDPVERDRKTEVYRSEPGIIDRTLEVINATTELID